MSSGRANPPLLLTRAEVARLVGLPLRELTWWVWALRPNRRYERYELERRSGNKPRVIHAPIKPIKDVQRRLVEVFTPVLAPPVQVHGYVRGRGPASNARNHRGQEWLLRVDLEDFFPSINFGRVHGLFLNFPFEYPRDVAALLAQICCHENELPQGAPTSPLISNFICRGMDKELARLAASERCYYSRYADDLCFSTDRTVFPQGLATRTGTTAVPGPDVTAIIKGNGFEINDSKTSLTRRTQRQRITGFVVNEKLNVSRDYIRDLRNLLFIWEVHGKADAKAAFARAHPRPNWPPGKPPPDFKEAIAGRVQHVGAVKGWDNPVYLQLATTLASCDQAFQPHAPPALPARSVRMYTEGESDVLHMKTASAAFAASDEFDDITLVTDENSHLRSDRLLLRQLEALARSPQAAPCVFMFDTDVRATVNDATEGAAWKRWSDSVVAVLLASPPFRSADDPLCIELLYEDTALELEDPNDRRIYQRSEFDDTTGHNPKGYWIPNPQNKTLIQETVRKMPDGSNVAMSKMNFARIVASGTPPHDTVSFEGFRPTFERIREALQSLIP